MKGSLPVCGTYGAYEFLSAAAKFFVDAVSLEIAALQAGGARDAV